MEQLNRIELRGNVGSVRLQAVGDKQVAKLTVATNYIYKGKDGEPVIETTWHNVTAWEGKNIANLNKVEKGDKVHILGRLRNQKFIGNDGVERTAYDVLAGKLEILDEDEYLQYES